MFCILFTFKFWFYMIDVYCVLPIKTLLSPFSYLFTTTLCTVIFVLDYLIWRKVRYFSSLLCFGQQIKHCIEHK